MMRLKIVEFVMSNLIKSGFSLVGLLRSLVFFGINYFKMILDINVIYR